MAIRTSILNRGAIVAQGLEEGGNTDITTLADTFLNLFLDQLAAEFDAPELLVEESITITSEQIDTTSLANTFRVAKAIHLDGAGNHPFELEEWPEGYIDIRTRIRRALENSDVGEPRWFFPDPNNDKLWLFPVPDASYNAALWYYRQPAALTDDGDFPWVPDASVCVAAVADFAARYERDPMHIILMENVALAKKSLRANQRRSGRQTPDALKFDRATHNWKRFR